MQKIANKTECNGCEACQAICPKKAIQMRLDNDGFYYPHIDEDKCVNCGLCGKVCPVQRDMPVRNIEYNDTQAYGGWIKDEQRLSESSSGGFCSALSEFVQQQGGVVYGVVFSDDFRRVYYASTDNVSLSRMKGSKYVTAQKNGIYIDAREKLKEGRKVLFIGLPCEIAGLYSYLGCDFDNLLTCELICAGSSSYKLLEDQLKWIEHKKGGRIKSFAFRAKKFGWVPYTMYAETRRGKYEKLFDETIFGVGMKYDKRVACFNCQMKGIFRVADFTVGDYWNIDKKASYYNEKGTSVIFSRTDKAEQYLKQMNDFYFEKVEAENAIRGNRQQLTYPAGIPHERQLYKEVFNRKGGYVAYKTFKPKQTLKIRIRNHLPIPIYLLLKRAANKKKG